MTATPVRSIRLFFREGSSDKVYQIQIDPAGSDLYHVNAYYGRRGSALAHAAKTAAGPVPLADAEKIYSKEIKGKQAKGYTPDEGGSVYVATSNEERVTGLMPQLLNVIDETEVERLLKDGSWVMQEKKDGVRIMGKVNETHTQDTTLSNRKGLSVSASTRILREVAEFPTGTVTDGELCGETYWLFDILQYGEKDYRNRPYSERFELFRNFEASYNDTITPDQRPMRVVPTAFTEAQKRTLYTQLVDEKREGVVFKKASAPYHTGRPNSGGNQVKFKFYSTATVQVLLVNDKRSAQVGVVNPMTGNGVTVGNVTILPNFPLPSVGDFVEVRYLYWFPGGSLYQPVYLGKREDKNVADSVDTLKQKPTDTDEG